MKTLFFRCCFICFIALFVLVAAPRAAAQVKPLLDNDQVDIHEVLIKVGEKTPKHSHSANEAIYVLSGGKGKVTLPDGTTRIIEYKTGELMWRTKPETHIVENTGETDIRLLRIQLKKPKAKVSTPPRRHSCYLGIASPTNRWARAARPASRRRGVAA
jgi:quercetin dioxygenase-like cupin family protein